MLRSFVALNILVSVTLWIPSWLKMWRLKSSREYSIFSFLLILYLQVANLALAWLESAVLLTAYMAVNVLAVGFTCCLIWKYRKGQDGVPAPSITDQKD